MPNYYEDRLVMKGIHPSEDEAWEVLWIGKQRLDYWEAPVAYVEFEFVYFLLPQASPLRENDEPIG